MLLRDRRFILTLLLMAVTAGYFWAGSRIPQLNEKAMMGGEVQLEALGFDIVYEVRPDDPVHVKVAKTTVNWIKTNQKGMTFGILFAGMIMTILALIQRRSFQNGFADSLLGMTIGAPLGVCVNCAAPIAQGMRSGGASTQTMLAAMTSSPTLNVIVLTMLFSLLPLYLVVLKLSLTLAFILIVIPVVARFVPRNAEVAFEPPEECPMPLALATGEGSESWLAAGRWLVKNYAKNLWFIVYRTVPLMLLAGALGAAAVTLLPVNTLAEVLPSEGPKVWMAMVLVAGVGVFLPVPIAFDVVLVAVLVAAGMPARYAAILLFTLGIFSVYAFFIAWYSIPRTIVVAATAVLVAMGVGAGYLGQIGFEWHAVGEREIFFAAFAENGSSHPDVIQVGEAPEPVSAADLLPGLGAGALRGEPFEASPVVGIEVRRIPFAAREVDPAAPRFVRLEGPEVGLAEPWSYSVDNFLELSRYRAIATGDVHHDGWPDVLVSTDTGISLYANRGGKGFTRQRVDVELPRARVVNAALVDLDGDGWLDIYLSCYRKGNHIVYNRGGSFEGAEVRALPNHEGAILTPSVAFGDLDRDSDLDVLLGNWSIGNIGRMNHSFDSSRNVLLRNEPGAFRLEALPGIPGETLSTLIADIDDDGDLDAIAGADFGPPDEFYLGSPDGVMQHLKRSSSPIPVSTGSTMNLSVADIDNDLRSELYIGQISGRSGSGAVDFHRLSPDLCMEIVDPVMREGCEKMVPIQRAIIRGIQTKSAGVCASLDEAFRDDCVAVIMLRTASRWERSPELCEAYPDSWDSFRFACRHSHVGQQEMLTDKGLAESVPQTRGFNVLLQESDQGYVNRAEQLGLQVAGWTWNAKFADLDNDEWQDMFAVNGQVSQNTREPSYMFHNQQGERFVDRATEWGMRTLLSIGGYSYVDMDNDGDLDIIAVPTEAPLLVFRNNSASGNSIAFEFSDQAGNAYGIGNRVIIHYGPDGKRHQMREIHAGGGFVSFDAPVAHFGLGEYDRVSRVEIVWSTGERTELEGEFTAGGRYVITRAARSATEVARAY